MINTTDNIKAKDIEEFSIGKVGLLLEKRDIPQSDTHRISKQPGPYFDLCYVIKRGWKHGRKVYTIKQ